MVARRGQDTSGTLPRPASKDVRLQGRHVEGERLCSKVERHRAVAIQPHARVQWLLLTVTTVAQRKQRRCWKPEVGGG